jgi:hypothetical protein
VEQTGYDQIDLLIERCQDARRPHEMRQQRLARTSKTPDEEVRRQLVRIPCPAHVVFPVAGFTELLEELQVRLRVGPTRDHTPSL